MRTKQEILNRIDSLNERYAIIQYDLEELPYPPAEQSLSEELDFIEAEINTLKWVLNLS